MARLLSLFATLLLVPATALAISSEHAVLTFPAHGVQAELAWIQSPKGNAAESIMKLEWYETSTHTLIDPAFEFSVELMMPSMGHGSSPVRIEHLSPGTYVVSEMYFTMPGDWDVNLLISDGKQPEEAKSWPVTVGGGHNHGH